MASGNLLYEHRELNPGLSDYLEGWKGMADVREIQEGGVVRIPIVDSCYVWQRPTQYCMPARPSFRESIVIVLMIFLVEILNSVNIKVHLSGQQMLVTKNCCPEVLRVLPPPYRCECKY